MKNRKNYHKVLKIIPFQIVVFALCTVIAEIFLWWAFPVPLETKVLVYQNLPGLKKEIVFEHNAFGLRSLSMRRKAKPDNTIRIFCLGASTTEQPTQATEDTWSGILENKLNNVFRDQNINIQVASYGNGGLKSTGLFLWANENIEEYDPDIVISLMGINDLAFNGGNDYYYSGIEVRPYTRVYDIMSFIKKCCKEYSQICRRIILAKRRVDIWRQKNTGKIIEWHSKNLPYLRENYKKYPYSPVITRDPDPFSEFQDAMSALFILLKRMNITTIVLGQPVLWKNSMNTEELEALWFFVNTKRGFIRPSGSWLLNEIQRYNNAQKQLAEFNNALYIDLDTQIPKTLEYYFDDCHYTDLGSRKVASAVFPEVKRQIEIILSK